MSEVVEWKCSSDVERLINIYGDKREEYAESGSRADFRTLVSARQDLIDYVVRLETFATAARNLGKQNCPDWGPSCKGPGCSACAFNAALAKVES